MIKLVAKSLASLAILLYSTQLFAGTKDGGGGNISEIEFVSVGMAVSTLISGPLGKSFPEVNADMFSQIVNSTHIEMVDQQLYGPDQVEKDALNFPSLHLIRVNQSHWQKLQIESKAELAFHEYLGIMGVEWNMYTVSARMAPLIASDDAKTLHLVNVEMPKYSCDFGSQPGPRTGLDHFTSCGNVELDTSNFGELGHGYQFVPGCSMTIMVLPSFMGFSIEIKLLPEGSDKNWTTVALHNPIASASYWNSTEDAPKKFQMTLQKSQKPLLGASKMETYGVTCTKE